MVWLKNATKTVKFTSKELSILQSPINCTDSSGRPQVQLDLEGEEI